MIWNDIKKDYQFMDGSVVTQIHPTYNQECCRVFYSKLKSRYIDCSWNHIFKIDCSRVKNKAELDMYTTYVPLEEEYEIITELNDIEREIVEQHFKGIKNSAILLEETPFDEEYYSISKYGFEFGEVEVISNITKYEPQKIDNNTYWLTCRGIQYLLNQGEILYCNGYKIKKVEDIGMKDAFCVSTNTGLYKMNGLIHHNSVTLRNLIFHSIEHGDEMAIALIDLKQVEFDSYRDMNHVTAVANSVSEALEVTRIARACMQQRNKKMKALHINNITAYIPTDYSGKIWISGREIPENDIVKVRIDGEEKEITALELFELTRDK